MSKEAKYHHLIPQTYLRNWCYQNDSIYTIPIENLEEVETKNIANNFGLNNYHTIKAGMPSCTEDDLLKIFAPLKNIDVYHEARLLTSLKEQNEFYYFFDEWVLKYKNGEAVNRKEKNKIKAEIEKCKILDIEFLWSLKYENGWSKLFKKIQQEVNNEKNNHIESFYKGKLMKFIVSLDWRSFIGNNNVNEVLGFFNETVNLSDINIPFEERDIPNDRTYLDWAKRNFLLKKFRDFLNEDGLMYDMAKGYIKNLTLKFLIAEGDAEFITSDNPSFTYKTKTGLKHIMPVSPSILVSVEKDSKHSGRYFIEKVNDDVISKINSIIIMNAQSKVISRKPTIHYDKTMLKAKLLEFE
ncbi:DUF4238 domain-containing protein [Paenibacillus chitinolyticus]|uniref:DUF4238 domain-containing protein n=1 Tax=Paenibacillus chitinolyticus TaxID=79263 RepID=UPI0036DE2BC0